MILFSQSQLNQQSKGVICSTHDLQAFQQQTQKQARLDRLKAVRQNEREFTKEAVQSYAEQQKALEEAAAKEARYQEYLNKKAMIEDLQK